MTAAPNDLARFTELPNTNDTGMRIRVGSLVQIATGYGDWAARSIPDPHNARFEGQIGHVECWHSYDGEREFIVNIDGWGICVAARFVTPMEY